MDTKLYIADLAYGEAGPLKQTDGSLAPRMANMTRGHC